METRSAWPLTLAPARHRDLTQGQLAALKQDAKDFGWHQMARECEKYTILEALLSKLDTSQQNLLCYTWMRYRQPTDNLVDAMVYYMKQLEEGCSVGAKQSFVAGQVRCHKETPQVGRLLSLYVDDSAADPTPFGEVRQRAYKIMSRDVLQSTAQRMSVKPLNKLALHQQAVDGLAEHIRRHLRPCISRST